MDLCPDVRPVEAAKADGQRMLARPIARQQQIDQVLVI
jgi:hypothetical protein